MSHKSGPKTCITRHSNGAALSLRQPMPCIMPIATSQGPRPKCRAAHKLTHAASASCCSTMRWRYVVTAGRWPRPANRRSRPVPGAASGSCRPWSAGAREPPEPCPGARTAKDVAMCTSGCWPAEGKGNTHRHTQARSTQAGQFALAEQGNIIDVTDAEDQATVCTPCIPKVTHSLQAISC